VPTLEALTMTLGQRINTWLDASASERQGRPAVDTLTQRHVHDVTFRPFEEPKSVGSANFLVPRIVSDDRRDFAWRHPPIMRIQLPMDAPPKIAVRVEFGVIRWISLELMGKKGPVQRQSMPKIPPRAFLTATAEAADGQRSWPPTSVAADHVRLRSLGVDQFGASLDVDLSKDFHVDFAVPDDRRIIRSYNEGTGTVTEGTEAKPGEFQLVETRSAVRVRLSATKRNEGGRTYVEISLENLSPLDPEEVRFNAVWRPLCIVFPTLEIRSPTTLTFPVPDEVRRIKEPETPQARAAYLEDVRTRAPRGLNAIATLHAKDPKVILGAMTAIHDTVLIEPRGGPNLAELRQASTLEKHLSEFTSAERGQLIKSGRHEILAGVMAAVAKANPTIMTLHSFQWLAIQRRARLLLKGSSTGVCQLVKAPTGSGKTLVFLANALLHFLWTGDRVAIAFPTRVLNEDMYRRLTLFLHAAREVFPKAGVTGGILIGSRDPLYRAVHKPEPGARMVQFNECPACSKRATIIGYEVSGRVAGKCSACAHLIDYMFGSGEALDYLPAILIATPDKLFYEATARKGSEAVPMRLFGGKARRCSCGAFSPDWWEFKTRCIRCSKPLQAELERRPIRFWIFDEVHSLHGLSGIYLSMFLAALQLYWKRATTPHVSPATSESLFAFEMGTATIANERELLLELTRVSGTDSLVFSPGDAEFLQHFTPRNDVIRYRTLITVPIACSATEAASRTLETADAILLDGALQDQLAHSLNLPTGNRPYEMNLTYVQRKHLGEALARDFNTRMAMSSISRPTLPFISGDTEQRRLMEFFHQAKQGDLKNFIANMVISLGLDISLLNHMIVVSYPDSTTEFVQVIGRTGRRTGVPGFAHLLLRPDLPRDSEIYERFRYMLCDLRGYFEAQPMQRANQYAAKRMFANLLHLVLVAHSENPETYVLTANKAAQRLTRSTLFVSVLQDLAFCMAGPTHPHYEEYLRLAHGQLEPTLQEWGRLTGPANYVGDLLQDDERLLLSLRDSAGREVMFRFLDPLHAQLQQQHHEALRLADTEAPPSEEEAE
jgi:hypothetical protein